MALVGQDIALAGQDLALAGQVLAVAGHDLTLMGQDLALGVGEKIYVKTTYSASKSAKKSLKVNLHFAVVVNIRSYTQMSS